MNDLSSDAAAYVARGIGAYIRAAKNEDLPARLRRFKGFTQKGLRPHAQTLLAALDDDAFRALVLEWLDEARVRIARDEASVLRLAVERPEGWVSRIEELVRPEDKAEPRAWAEREPPDDELWRAKAKRAREDARTARQEAKTAERDATARVESIKQELSVLKARAEESERSAKQLARELERTQRDLERERRKVRSVTERGRAQAETLRRHLTEARREVARLTRASEPQPSGPRPRKKPSAAAMKKSGPRTPLRAPKGRLADDPETLDEWLEVPHVHLLIDGYNVTKAVGGFGGLDLSTQRERLIDEVAKLSRKKKVPATIVFDGSDVAPGTSRRPRRPITVEYSKPDETADDHLMALLSALPPDPVIVATNDRELQSRAQRKGATIATSTQLLALIR